MAGTAHLMGRRVHFKIGQPEPGILLRTAAKQCSNARRKFGKRKRLGKIVVGACVESGDPVLESALGCKHEHRKPWPLLPDLA